MIAEILLVLAGHSSSLFPEGDTLNPAFNELLHPGERECLESLGRIAFKYRKIKGRTELLSKSRSRYVCAACATLNQILRDDYESLVVQTEERVLKRDSSLVASGSFVPLSSIRATFSEWDAPLSALASLVDQVEIEPGPLIDLLLVRSRTGVYRIADILTRISQAVQKVWRTQLVAFLVHGSIPQDHSIVSKDYELIAQTFPTCVSIQSRDSIAYVGRAVATVRSGRWKTQLPRVLAQEHTAMLTSVLPEDRHGFDRVISQIRLNVSEWLWLNVLTDKDVEDAVDSLANYFLLRNGEFSLALIREFERLKVSRLTSRAGPSSLIREQDLNLALLRASLGTSAQHDPKLDRLRFSLPAGPLRPLLPPLANVNISISTQESITFDDLLLGTPLALSYTVTWPLDLFLHPSDLQLYSVLFSYLSSLRKTHTRIHTCWASLSNSQRVRRRWTGLDEGGTAEDSDIRRNLLRCGWGVVRDMGWFLDNLLGYVMNDVVDVEFRRLKAELGGSSSDGDVKGLKDDLRFSSSSSGGALAPSGSHGSVGLTSSGHIDFTTLRNIHKTYLERLLTGCLLTNPGLTSILRPMFEVCERFVTQVERWGNDVLPELLFEGSLAAGSEDGVGAMVKERWAVVQEINEAFHTLLDSFYDQLSVSTSQQAFASHDASKSIMNLSNGNATSFHQTTLRRKDQKGLESDGEVRRNIEGLLLRLDFNGVLSEPRKTKINILKEGGLA